MQIKIFESAKEYLIENFGNLVSAGEVYFDKRNNTWNVKIAAKTPHGIIPVGELLFDFNGNLIEAPTKETLLSILKTKLNEERERVIIKVHAKDLPEIRRVVKDVHVL
jgi:hypothetical protein